MASANLAQFKILLAKEASMNGLPSVVLKDSTDLGQAFARLVSLDNRKEGETDEQLTARYVEDFCGGITSEMNAEPLEVFNAACEAFSEKVKTAWDSLEGIRDQAAMLAQDMDKAASSRISSNDFISSHLTYDKISTDFPVWNWRGPAAIGSRNDIITDVHALVVDNGAEIPTDIDQHLFNIVVSDLSTFTQINGVSCGDDERNGLIQQLQAIYAETPVEKITTFVDLVLGLRGWTREFDVLARINAESPSRMFQNIQMFDAFIEDYFAMADSVQSEQVKVGEGIKEGVRQNAERIMRFCEIAAYYENMLRETTYKLSLLLPGGLVNADTQEQFNQAGGNNQMLGQYVRYYYKDDRAQIPALGIAGDAIVKASGSIGTKIDEDIQKTMAKVQLTKNEARVAAFQEVAVQFIERKLDGDGVNGIAKGHQINELLKKHAEPIKYALRQYNIPFMDAALSLVVKLGFGGTFVEHLYERLGAAYLNAVKSNLELDANAINNTEVGVVAELIAEFVANNLVDAVTITERPPIPAATEGLKNEEPVVTPPVMPGEGQPPDNPDIPLNPQPGQVIGAPAQETK